MAKIEYTFSAKLWKHDAPGGWFFVSIPKEMSKEIREHLQWQEEGWGRMKASAIIKEIQWDTAIWYDTKNEAYILPVKAAIRKKTHIQIDEEIKVYILL